MAARDRAFLAFVSAGHGLWHPLFLFTPDSGRFSPQRSSVPEVAPGAGHDCHRTGPVARLRIRKRTAPEGMAGLFLDLSNPYDQRAGFRLSGYRRRQTERDEDNPSPPGPSPNSRAVDAFSRGPRFPQRRAQLAPLGQTPHAGGVDPWMRRFAPFIAMANTPHHFKCAGGHAVIPPGGRGVAEVKTVSAGGRQILRDVDRVWNGANDESEAFHRALRFTRQSDDQRAVDDGRQAPRQNGVGR